MLKINFTIERLWKFVKKSVF